MKQTTTTDTILKEFKKEFFEKCGEWFRNFHPNNIVLMEKYLDQCLLSAISKTREETIEEIFDKIENTFSWTMPVKKTKDPGKFKIMTDMYLHFEWKTWVKFKKDIPASLKEK